MTRLSALFLCVDLALQDAGAETRALIRRKFYMRESFIARKLSLKEKYPFYRDNRIRKARLPGWATVSVTCGGSGGRRGDQVELGLTLREDFSTIGRHQHFFFDIDDEGTAEIFSRLHDRGLDGEDLSRFQR